MIATILGAWLALRPHLPQLSADDVLSKVNRTYDAMDSYMDWGSVTFSYESSNGERRGERRLFNTAFKRPGRLRYEFVEPAAEGAREKRWITWTSVRHGYVTWTNWLPNETDHVSLAKSLFRAWGMAESCGLSLKLLAPWAIEGPKATEIYKQTIAGETVNGRPCWKIEGVCESGARAWIWVDCASSLVVKYRHALDADLDGKPTHEIYTVELHPQANPRMGREDLSFSPPESHNSRRHTKRKRRRRRHHK